ncbi:MAG: lyase family protein [Thermomicrobiales bacterium]
MRANFVASRRLDLAREDMRVGRFRRGQYPRAHVPPDVEEEACTELGLAAAPASTQIIQRDRHAFFVSVLAGIRFDDRQVRRRKSDISARTEVREAEAIQKGNQGSSAMPHKRNPHESGASPVSRVCLRGYAVTASENVALWHERDISHGSTERVIFPDACRSPFHAR